MSQYDNNEDLTKAFKSAIKNPAERARLLSEYPELKSALAFYEKNESHFNQNSPSTRYAHIVLKTLKENICFQLNEDGPTSFDEITKIQL